MSWVRYSDGITVGPWRRARVCVCVCALAATEQARRWLAEALPKQGDPNGE